MASSIRSATETFSQSHLLRHFVPANRHLFPVQVRVLEYDEPVTVLDHHQVEAGSQLVLHGWTRQPKILAVSGQRRYAIPLSYPGTFRVIARTFQGVAGLDYSAQKKQRLRVIEANPDSEDEVLAVREGDLIEAFGQRVVQGHGEEYIGCEKTDEHTGQRSEVFLSTSCNLSFEEVIEDLPVAEEGPGQYNIRDFVSALAARSFDVQLVQPGPDHLDPTMDLPINSPINLRKHVIEPAVYASLDSPLSPAFHIPVRATIFVRFMRQLPRGCSPLLNKQNARLSTLDRCVELLTPDVFNEIINNQKHFLQIFQTRPKGAPVLPAAGQRGRRRLTSSQSQLDSLESSSIRKGPGSMTGSVRSFSAESLSGRIKSRFGFKFKRSRSSTGSDFGSVKSLPVTSNKKSNRIQFLMSSGDSLGTGSLNRNKANQKEFRLPEFQNRPRFTAGLSANQKQSFTLSANHMKTPYNGSASQKQSTKGRLGSHTVNGNADDDDDDDDEVSTNQDEPRSKSPPQNNEKAGAFSQSLNSVTTVIETTNHGVKIADKGRANQSADLKASANQKITPPSSDDIAPIQRSTLSPPRKNGYDITAGTSRDIYRRNSVSSTDAVSLQSISGSVSSNSSYSNRNTNNGTGSILSFGSGGSILKKSSHHSHHPPPPLQLQKQQNTTDNKIKQPQMNSASFNIPPGFALVPLDPERSAIPPGFALVPASDAQQIQQQQLPKKEMQRQQLPQQQLQQQQQQLQQQHQLQQQQMQQQLQQQHLRQQHLEQQTLQQQPLHQQQLQLQPPNGAASSTSSSLSTERTFRQVTFDNETIDSDSDVTGSILNLNFYNGRPTLPADANLYSFSVKKFTEFLVCLNLDESVIRACKKHRIDGKRFSRMTDQDLEQRGILQPIVLYFRKHTNKRPFHLNA